jgi:hypothetical protein
MITSYNGKRIVVCDGCVETFTSRDGKMVEIEMLRRGWRVNDSDYSWAHFCPDCAPEFAADEPVRRAR